MVNEVAWQTKIINRVRDEGGYGKKWSSTYAVGVPDLILSATELNSLFMEIKLEKNWVKNTTRTISLTELQKIELNKLRNAGSLAYVGVILELPGPGHALFNVFKTPDIDNKLTIDLNGMKDNSYHWKTNDNLISYIRRRIHDHH